MILPIKDDIPRRGTAVVTAGIVAVNVAVFLYAYFLGPVGFNVFTMRMGLIPFEITHATDAISPTPIPVYLTIFTAMFMHGGWLHLGGNMLYLWIFGKSVEDALGHTRFLGFYLLCGVIATIAHVLSAPEATVPLVGASGAIAGLMGAYMAAFPGARVHVLVFLFIFIQVIRVPAIFALGLWFLLQLLSASGDVGGAGGGVAWYAHIGGFIVGYLLMWLRRRRIRRVYAAWL